MKSKFLTLVFLVLTVLVGNAQNTYVKTWDIDFVGGNKGNFAGMDPSDVVVSFNSVDGYMHVDVFKSVYSWSFLRIYMGNCWTPRIVFDQSNRYIEFRIKSQVAVTDVLVNPKGGSNDGCPLSVGKTWPVQSFSISNDEVNTWKIVLLQFPPTTGGTQNIIDTMCTSLTWNLPNGNYIFDYVKIGEAAIPPIPVIDQVSTKVIKNNSGVQTVTLSGIEIPNRPFDGLTIEAKTEGSGILKDLSFVDLSGNGDYIDIDAKTATLKYTPIDGIGKKEENIIITLKDTIRNTSKTMTFKVEVLSVFEVNGVSAESTISLCNKKNVFKTVGITGSTWTYPAGVTAVIQADSAVLTFPNYDISGFVKANHSGGKDSIFVNYHYITSTNPIISDSSLCLGNVVNFTTATSPGITKYIWTLPSGASFIGNNTGNTVKVLFNLEASTASIKVQGENDFCQSTIQTKTISINNNNFSLAISPAGTQILTALPMKASFFNNTANRTDYNFKWEFGDGGVDESNINPVSYTYKKNGTYDVVLTAQKISSGCRDTLKVVDAVACSGGEVCSHIATISRNSTALKCEGDSIELTANTGTGFTYQWFRNGSPIQNANLQKLNCKISGTYTLEVYKDNCIAISDPEVIKFNAPTKPTISLAAGTITPCLGGSVILYASAGYNLYKWNNDSVKQSITVIKSGWYSVTVTDENGCKATSDPYMVNASQASLPSICAVTVDPITNKNVILWDRLASEKIKTYKIFKEGSSVNEFNLIGESGFVEINSFIDDNSNSLVSASRYAVSVIDSCNIESPISLVHKTMHLTLNERFGGGVNLIWTPYEGLNIPGYKLYRGESKDDMKVFDSIASSLTSYTIIDNLATYYQIGINLPKNCEAAELKSEAGPYGQSLSNIAEYKGSGISSQSNEMIQIFPNPAKDNITILSSGNGVLTITDVTGKVMLKQKIQSTEMILNISTLISGSYIVNIISDEGIANQILYVE